MFLKDHLKGVYQKASFDKNHLALENIINRWAHRFGIESLNDLIDQNQDQINLKEEDQEEEKQNQDQINLKEKDQEKENQNQDQINLKEEDQEEEKQNQNQIRLTKEDKEEESHNQSNLNLLENVQSQVEINFESNETKNFNKTEIVNTDSLDLYKNTSEYLDKGNLPLPNINNLRKWINNEKKAS